MSPTVDVFRSGFYTVTVHAFLLLCVAAAPIRQEILTHDEYLSPIIFIPGKGGNQLMANVDKPAYEYDGCPTQRVWHRLWLDSWSLIMGEIRCNAENMMLKYDTKTRRSSNVDGVNITVPGWGWTNTIEYLDPSWTAWIMGNMGAYAAPLVDALVNLGYERGVNLRGAPYDFRFAPHSHELYYTRLKSLIEETWRINGRRRVIIVSHSMGGIFARYFLVQQSADWKAKYVKAFVPLSTPWEGSTVLYHLLTCGYNWGLQYTNQILVRDVFRSYETSYLLLPKNTVWGPDDVIVQTATRNYTAADHSAFFHDLNYTVAVDRIENVKNARDLIVGHPGVDTYCFYGSGLPTTETLVYDEDGFNGQPRRLFGNGDGSVNSRSLNGCTQWPHSDEAGQRLHAREIAKTSHDQIMERDEVMELLNKLSGKELLEIASS